MERPNGNLQIQIFLKNRKPKHLNLTNQFESLHAAEAW